MARISEIILLRQIEQPVLEIVTTTNLQGIGQTIGLGFITLMEYITNQGELVTDFPYVLYPQFEKMDKNYITIVIGVKTAYQLPDNGNIKSSILPSRKVISSLYMGSYSQITPFYEELSEWIKRNNLEQEGDTYEYYYTGQEVPEKDHVTRVELPLK